MTRQIALAVFVLFTGWLFYRDRKARPGLSSAIWIPLLWALIIGSRPVSLWFSGALASQTTGDDLEGSSFDRNVFLGLIVAGLWVLRKRQVSWSSVFAQNRWVFLFYLFCAVSAFWSDYPFVSFKRWFKIFGHVIMVLVILSENNPAEAVKAVLFRSAFVLVLLSVLLIKYYTELGRGFSHFTFEPISIGAALGKNELGITLVVSGLAIFWEFLDVLRQKGKGSAVSVGVCLILLAMTCYLLVKAKSATSLACTVLGCGALYALRLPAIQVWRPRLVSYSVVGAVMLFILSSVFDLGSIGLQLLGRDPSLTGRTEIWGMVLKAQSSPVLGAGFYTFWMGQRADRLSENYFFRLNQAHNGYLETYLDLGVVGVILLVAMIAAGGRVIQQRLVQDIGWGSVAFVFWVIVVVHNWTEASFARLNPLWFVFLLVAIEYKPWWVQAPVPAHAPEMNSFRHAEAGG